jgi:phosphate transport system substrate-binding protein
MVWAAGRGKPNVIREGRVSKSRLRTRDAAPTRRWIPHLLGALIGLALSLIQAATAFAADPATLRIATPHRTGAALRAMLTHMAEGRAADVKVVSEATRSLLALRQFCQPRSADTPDIVLSIRPMPASLQRECEAANPGYVGVQLGRTAIVLAMRAEGRALRLSTRDIWLALARDVPVGDEFRRNVSIRWSDIDPALGPQDIRFQLPPTTDYQRQLFDALVLEGGCRKDGAIKGIYEAAQRTQRCTTTRGDRVREITRENAVRALLEAPPGTIGVLSLNEVQASEGKLIALSIDGVTPSATAIQNASYNFAETEWLFARDRATLTDPRLVAELDRVVDLARSEAMIGPGGVLATGGVIPLADDEREAQRQALSNRDPTSSIGWITNWVVATLQSGWTLLTGAVDELRGGEAHEHSVDLALLMEIAGYKLSEFESNVGLIPGAGMIFKISREMSDSDRAYLERELYRDSRMRRSLRAAFQRWLIRAIIDVSETGGYQVSKVDLTLLPLPNVKLSITESGSGGSESAVILRALERLQERLPEAPR